MGEIPFGELVDSIGSVALHDTDLIAAREISFAEIVSAKDFDSIPESDFAKHFCTKQMLHIAQDDRTRFEHLLSWQRINDILSMNILDRKFMRLTRDGREIPHALYRKEDSERDAVDARKLHGLIRQNASVALNGAHFLSPPIRRLALQMEVALGQKVNVNAYMTFGPGGAFDVHYDSHDVLVFQVYGSKHWFLYEKPEPFPIDYKAKAKPDPREVAFDVVLQAGDVLYVPRGMYHRAAVTDTDSLHLTFGIHTFKGIDFIDVIRKKAEKEDLFREDILGLRGPEAVAEQERLVKARLCELINERSFLTSVDKWHRNFSPVDQIHLGPREALDDHTTLSPLVRSREAWRDSVKKNGKEPSDAAQRILDALVAKESATFGELKAELAGVLDEDTLKSTLAELIDDCWIEVTR